MSPPAGPGGPPLLVAATFAMSIDGKIAPAHGPTPRLAGAPDLALLMALRAESDVLMVGANTLRASNPPMQSHLATQPLVVVVSGSGDVPAAARALALLPDGEAPWLVTAAETSALSAPLQQRIAAKTLTHVVLPATGGQVALGPLIRQLSAAGRRRVLVEGGGALLGTLAAAMPIDELYLTVAPLLLGGQAPTPLAGPGFAWAERQRFVLCGARVVAGEVQLHYVREPGDGAAGQGRPVPPAPRFAQVPLW